MENTLYYGDNLDILRKYIHDKSIDLIYLDPPFNSKVNYNVIFKTKNQEDAPAQIQAFEDTWKWGDESGMVLSQVIGLGNNVSQVLDGLFRALGTSNLMAYITMMTIRLWELYRVLKSTGALYLHCDSTASHYLKVILDSIFGTENYRNEIIWECAIGGKIKHQSGFQTTFPKNSNTLLFYAKEDHRMNPIYIFDEKHTKSFNKIDENGRHYKLGRTDISASMGRRPNQEYTYKGYTPPFGWRFVKSTLEKLDAQGKLFWNSKGKPYKKLFLDESKGFEIGSVWTDIGQLTPQSNERMGYPTQKPLKLLERVILASSKENDLILDPFCGCGTAIVAAEKLKRQWIGIDITHLAVSLMKERLLTRYNIHPKVIGEPETLDAAKQLAQQDAFQFEAWAVSKIPGMHPTKKTGDKGIDGRGYVDIGDNNFAKVVMSVKGGKSINPSMIQSLRGAMETAHADLGIFMCLKNPTKGMIAESTISKFFETPLGQKFPKVQIYTIEDYFAGKKPNLPNLVTQRTDKIDSEEGIQTKLL